MLQFVLFLCCAATLLGFMSVACLLSWYQAGRLLTAIGGKRQPSPRWPSIGCAKAVALCSKPRPKAESGHTLTGQPVIDAQLEQALQYGMRDFVQSWFHIWVSPNPAFPDEVQRAIVTVVTELTQRFSQADLATLLSQRLLEESLLHLVRCKEAVVTSSTDSDTGCLAGRVLAGLPDDDPWSAVCLEPDTQRAYLQGVSELLLLLVLPSFEFASPPLRHFFRDVLTQQVWIPLLQTLSTPDYINTTLISLCKEVSLNSESFLAAVRTPYSVSEVEGIREFVATETDRLKVHGVSGTDKQRLASLDAVMATIEKQLGGELEEGIEEVESSLPLSLTVSIPGYKLHTGRHVDYSVSVQCRHTEAGIVESWTTLRQFSDFHDLHITLRNTLGSLPALLFLPSRRALKKFDPAFLDARRRGLETYLQTLVSESFLTRHPPALPIISVFISDEPYQQSSNELNRQMDRLMHPFKKTRNPQLVTANKAMSSPLLLQRQHRINTSQDGAEEEDQDLDLLLRLLDALFDLRDHGQWLRRQLAHILSQLLGDRVSRKVAEGMAWLTSSEQVSQYFKDLTLNHLLQDQSLNMWLCLRLLEASLQTLFPSHSLSPALRSLRQQLHTGHAT